MILERYSDTPGNQRKVLKLTKDRHWPLLFRLVPILPPEKEDKYKITELQFDYDKTLSAKIFQTMYGYI